MKFKHQILLAFSIIFLILLCVVISTIAINKYSSTNNKFNQKVLLFHKEYEDHILRDSQEMNSIIRLLARDKQIQKLWQLQDRKKLYQQTKGIFEGIKKRNRITHFYFIGLDESCFLRVHNPTRFGDHIARHTFIKARDNEQLFSGISYGIELGTFSTLALRVVYPWKIDGKLVGYIELASEIDHLLEEIKRELNLNSIIIIRKSLTNQKKWEEGQQMLGASYNWNALSDFVISAQTINIQNIKFFQSKRQQINSYEDILYLQKNIDLMDVRGNEIGKTLLLFNIEKDLKSLQRTILIVLIAFISFGIILSFIFIFIVSIIENKILKIEKNLIEEKLFQSTIINSLDVALHFIDLDYNICFYNNTFERWLTKFDIKIKKGKNLKEIFPFLAQVIYDEYQQVVETRKLIVTNEKNEMNDEVIFSETRKIPVIIDNKVVGVITIIKDVSKQKKEEEEKKSMQLTLLEKEKFASLGELAGGVAHEINNPIQIIVGTVRRIKKTIIKESIESQKLITSLENIDLVSERIAKIVKGLLSLAPKDGFFTFKSANIVDLVNNTLNLCKEKFNNNRIKLIFENKEIFNQLKIDCKEIQIGQVLMNLLDNACHAVSSCVDKWVTVKINEQNDSIIIMVIDSGNGIPEEIIDKIMRPFFTTKSTREGTGLGLSLSLKIINQHKGSLVYGLENNHTKFTITLPKKQVQYNG